MCLLQKETVKSYIMNVTQTAIQHWFRVIVKIGILHKTEICNLHGEYFFPLTIEKRAKFAVENWGY